MDFINILSLDPASSIELVILYAALCAAHAGLRFTAWQRGDGGVRQAYGNAVLHGHLCARGRRAIMMAVPVAELPFACQWAVAAWQCVHVHVRTCARGCTVHTLGRGVGGGRGLNTPCANG